MAQAPALPSITIPSAIYTIPVQQELKNAKLEGDGVKFTFLREAWPEGLCFTLIGELSQQAGQPDYKPWFGPSEFFGGVQTGPGGVLMESTLTAQWQNEPGGKQKGDVRITLTPAQTFRTTITIAVI